MTEHVIYNDRQGGKTYTIMTEIHDLILAGERPWIMVVFPTMNYVHWWGRMWMARFPSIPLPNYTSVQGMDRVRGRKLRHVFVEDIDGVVDGIYDPKLNHLRAALVPGGTITFTCSQIPEGVWRTPPPRPKPKMTPLSLDVASMLAYIMRDKRQ